MNTNRKIAKAITDDLFTTGTGHRVWRLLFQLREFENNFAGSLTREEVIAIILKHLPPNKSLTGFPKTP